MRQQFVARKTRHSQECSDPLHCAEKWRTGVFWVGCASLGMCLFVACGRSWTGADTRKVWPGSGLLLLPWAESCPSPSTSSCSCSCFSFSSKGRKMWRWQLRNGTENASGTRIRDWVLWTGIRRPLYNATLLNGPILSLIVLFQVAIKGHKRKCIHHKMFRCFLRILMRISLWPATN